MLYRERQQKEIETIRERKITIKLSDADCERISKLCGIYNITVAELLESFIGDLVGGTYSNGSDKRDCAEEYFYRCGFGMDHQATLLSWLLDMSYDVYGDFLEVIDNIKNGYAELEDYTKDPSVFDEEEIEFLRSDIEDWENQIAEIKTEFLNSRYQFTHQLPKDFTDDDWNNEIEEVNAWWKAKELLMNTSEPGSPNMED